MTQSQFPTANADRPRQDQPKAVSSKLPTAEVHALWARADLSNLTLLDLSETCVEHDAGPDEILNELAVRLAEGYLAGSLTYEFCDNVVNGLFGAIIEFGMDNGLPEPAFDIYLAFDQGEWVRESDPQDIDPSEKYTRPAVIEIMRGLGALPHE